MSNDLISRQAAIEALWKALYEYEDKTEKQFQESDELDVGDWIQHREFVQNMSDIDRRTILDLPSAQPEIVRCEECKHRPTKPDDYNPITMDGFALEFPDEKCPCQCEDGWYSKYPDDDWYCPIGERKGGDE